MKSESGNKIDFENVFEDPLRPVQVLVHQQRVQLHGDQEKHPGQNKPERKKKKHLNLSKCNISLDLKFQFCFLDIIFFLCYSYGSDSVKKTRKQKHIEVCQKLVFNVILKCLLLLN